MKTQVVVGLMVLSLIFAGRVLADEKQHDMDHATHEMAADVEATAENTVEAAGETVTEVKVEAQDAAALVVVGNKFCPVSGHAVGEMGPTQTIEYNGKVYNLCCAMCSKDFNKDPEKYIKIIEEKEGLK